MPDLDELDDLGGPDLETTAHEVFGLSLPVRLPAFSRGSRLTPTLDPTYKFQPEVLTALLLGFARGRRVMLTGLHGAGKSSHLEQVAARLNWPCVRINLDGHVGRVDLLGRDAVVLEQGGPTTRFQEGILPWAIRRPVALIFDEYDAGRPDVMFVLQRLLEHDGRLTLLEERRIVEPHPAFRMFATANTTGQGDASGLYAGTQVLNQAQLDRWNLVVDVPYMTPAAECAMVEGKIPELSASADLRDQVARMVELANWTRRAYQQGELSILMSPRSVLHWAQAYLDLQDVRAAFRIAFFHRCDPLERGPLVECFQRLFDEELEPPGGG